MEFDAEVVRRLGAVSGNKACADCGEPDPEWASINIGVMICVQCSGAHRSLGTHISQVRSMKLDNWTEEQIAKMEMLGNVKVNARLELFVPKYIPRPSEFPGSDSVRKHFIQLKYEIKAFETYKDEEEERHQLCQKEGFLLKQGKADSSKWQKRWIVLSEGALAYYRSAESPSPKGVIQLGAFATFTLPAPLDIGIVPGPYQREYKFRCTSGDEVVDWLTALRASRCVDGRGSIVRRALGSTVDADTSAIDDGIDEKPPGSEELCRDASRVLSDGHCLKQGWLHKRNVAGMVPIWNKRYFMLIPEGALYYFKSSSVASGKWKDPMGAMSIVGASIEIETQRPFAFAIRTPEAQLIVCAENDEDRHAWIDALKFAAEAHVLPGN